MQSPSTQIDEILSTRFVPPTLVARGKQLSELTKQTSTGRASNYFCQGWTNTGKTATVTKAMEILTKRPNQRCLYVKCERSLWMPFRDSVVKFVGALPFRTRPIEGLFTYCENHEINFLHVYLDDAHMVSMYDNAVSLKFTDIAHKLYESAKAHGVKLQLVFIGSLPYITYIKFIEQLHLDDRARMQFKPIIFDNYTTEEMTTIYTDRLKLAGIHASIEAVKWVVSTVKLNAGELPMGFEILCAGVEELLDSKAPTLTMQHVQNAFSNVKVDYWRRQLAEMDRHLSLIFTAATIVSMNKYAKDDGPEQQIFLTGQEVAREYERLCGLNHEKVLYAQRRNYLLRKLSIQGFLGKIGVDNETDSVRYRYELNPLTMVDTLKAMDLLPKNI